MNASERPNAAQHPIVKAVEMSKTIYEALAALDARLDGTVLENDWASLLQWVGEAQRQPGGNVADGLFVALRRFNAHPPAKPDAYVDQVTQDVVDALEKAVDMEDQDVIDDVVDNGTGWALVATKSGKRYRVLVREVHQP